VQVTGASRILAIVGGLHLLHAGLERLERTVEALKAYDIAHLCPCHCTGDESVAFLRRHLGDSVQAGYAGMKVSF
jgi:7,8-dihydropterin-6-yl-methyl-4-(beta-D-ribofuranosyl)aminobenzene 5'-phosphate synthase